MPCMSLSRGSTVACGLYINVTVRSKTPCCESETDVKEEEEDRDSVLLVRLIIKQPTFQIWFGTISP